MPESRHKRQLGLVNQRRLEDLVVVVEGSGGPLPFLLTNLVLLGAGSRHGGILLKPGKPRVGEEDVAGQFLLSESDLGREFDDAILERLHELNPDSRVFSAGSDLEHSGDIHLLVPGPEEEDGLGRTNGVPRLWGQVSGTSIAVGPTRLEVPIREANLLTPSLNSLCAAVLAQELLLRTRCIRRTTFAKSWVSVNYHIRKPGIGKALWKGEYPLADLEFRSCTGVELAGHPTDVLGEDEVIVRVPLPQTEEVTALLAGSVEMFEDVPAVPPPQHVVWSPFPGVGIEGGRLVDPHEFSVRQIERKQVFVAGVGALGSWLAVLLAVSNTRDCEVTLADMDDAVARHNLNRQVLYTEADIGRSKAAASASRLRELNGSNRWHPIAAEIDPGVIDLASSATTESYEAYTSGEEFVEAGGGLQMRRDAGPVLAGQLLRSDVVAACLDNLLTRYHLNVVCESARIPLINAAAEEFEGRAHRVDARRQDPCLVCRLGEGIKTDGKKAPCGEEGEIPVQSIVTTSAVMASIQTILVLLSLSGYDGGWCNWAAFEGTRNRLSSGPSKPRWPDDCPDHLWPGIGV